MAKRCLIPPLKLPEDKIKARNFLAVFVWLWLLVGWTQAGQLDSIQKFLESKIIAQYALTPSDSYSVHILNSAEIESLLNHQRIKLTADDLILANDFSLLGKKIVNLKTISKGDLVIPVFAEMRASTNVFELSRPLGRHVLIQEQDLNEVKRDLTFMPKGFIRDKNEILGKESAVYIRAGQPFFSYMIREVPPVHQKDKLKLRWADPLVTVQVEGIALEDGYMDQEIMVMNLSSNKKLKGVVRAPGVVEIK